MQSDMKFSPGYIWAFLLLLLLPSAAEAQVDIDGKAAKQRAVDYYFMQAQSLVELERYDEGFELLEHCYRLDSASATIQYYLSTFYTFFKEDSVALSMLKNSVAAYPDNKFYSEALVSFYTNKGDRQSAIAVCENLLGRVQSKRDIYYFLYELYVAENDNLKALETLEMIEKIEGSDNETVALEKLQRYLMLGENEKAIAVARRLIDENPGDGKYISYLGNAYFLIGEDEKANELYSSVLKETPDDAIALNALAALHDLNGDTAAYNATMERLLKSEKTSTNKRLEELVGYVLRREVTDSAYVRRLFDEMMQLPFDEVPIAESYIQYLNYKNAPADEIVPVYKRILEKDPEHLRAIVHLLDFAVKQNSIEDVLKYCDDALRYLPDMLELYYYKGVSYNMLDRKEESIEVFLDGLEKRSNDADLELVSRLWSMIGDTYYELDKEAETYQAYDSSLVYNPNNVITLNNYAYYLALEGKQLQKALEMSSKCVQLEPENCTYIDTHAWVLFSLGRYEEARAYADKIVALNPEMGYVELHHNGDIYAKCGDIDKAVEFWTKARDAGDTGKVLSKKIKKRKYYPNAKRR